MNPDELFNQLFDLSGPLAVIGWLALLVSPLLPRLAQWVAGLIVPTILSVAYAALILANWADAPGGFDSLGNVMLLFDVPAVALAGWLHYLAFDLFVGAWIARTARAEGVPHLLVMPCLVLTFLFGPIGFVLFLSIRFARRLGGYPLKAA
ncbi:MAG: ABA4-like family protein [Burkholderiaceae bacterium]